MQKIVQDYYVQVIIALLVTVPPIVFFIINGGLWGFSNLVDFDSQFSIASLIIFLLLYIPSFLFVFALIKSMIVNPTYIFFIGILSLSSFLSWGFILAGGGVQDGLGIYLIVVPAIFGTLLIMLIDRILVSKYGTKRVNKFERIILILLSVIKIFQMLSIRIQDTFID